MFYLEGVGVAFAKKGMGVAGQIEDELKHQFLFRKIAELNGGLRRCTKVVGDLFDYIHQLEATPEVETAFGLVGELWAQTLMEHLSPCWYPHELSEILEDERRHLHIPIKGKVERITEIVREFEKLLVAISSDPDIAVPVSYVLGTDGLARLAMDCVKRHRSICRRLGVEETEEMRKARRAALAGMLLAQNQPKQIPMSEWDKDRQFLFSIDRPEFGFVKVALDGRKASLAEAIVVQKLAENIVDLGLNKSIRDGKLYAPHRICIGVRRQRKEGIPTTIPICDPHLLTTTQVCRRLQRRLRKVNSHPYVPIHKNMELGDLLPPSKTSWSVSYTGAFGKGSLGGGMTPLAPFEGLAGSVVIGAIHSGVTYLGFTVDHRVVDGEDMVRLMDGVRRSLHAHSILR
jgi:hypothetical protein